MILNPLMPPVFEHANDSNVQRTPTRFTLTPVRSGSDYSINSENNVLLANINWQCLVETTSLPESDSSGEENETDESQYQNTPSDRSPGSIEIRVLDVDAGQLGPMQTIHGMQHPERASFLSLDTAILSPPCPERRAFTRLRASLPPDLTIYKHAISTPLETLASLLVGPKIDMVNGALGIATYPAYRKKCLSTFVVKRFCSACCLVIMHHKKDSRSLLRKQKRKVSPES
jgi:hypothetical protein